MINKFTFKNSDKGFKLAEILNGTTHPLKKDIRKLISRAIHDYLRMSKAVATMTSTTPEIQLKLLHLAHLSCRDRVHEVKGANHVIKNAAHAVVSEDFTEKQCTLTEKVNFRKMRNDAHSDNVQKIKEAS